MIFRARSSALCAGTNLICSVCFSIVTGGAATAPVVVKLTERARERGKDRSTLGVCAMCEHESASPLREHALSMMSSVCQIWSYSQWHAKQNEKLLAEQQTNCPLFIIFASHFAALVISQCDRYIYHTIYSNIFFYANTNHLRFFLLEKSKYFQNVLRISHQIYREL